MASAPDLVIALMTLSLAWSLTQVFGLGGEGQPRVQQHSEVTVFVKSLHPDALDLQLTIWSG